MLAINERLLLDTWKFELKCIINSFTHFRETIFHVLIAPMPTVRNYEVQFHVCKVVGASDSAINTCSYYTFHVVNLYDILQFSETCLTVSFDSHNKYFLINYIN
jgi:hypothetical protein